MKKKIIFLILFMFLVSGCTNYLQDKDKKRIVYESTGQSLPSNILCKPTDNELTELYKQYSDNMEVKLSELPKCSNLKAYDSKNYSGLWVFLFVRPLAWVIIKIGSLVNSYGVAVMIVSILIRLILMPFSNKTMKQSENMKKAQPEINRLELKYKDKTDRDSMMQKSQETMMIYKKYDIKPMGSCLVTLIQIPVFFAFLEAINRIPVIFEEYLGAFQLGTTPLVAIQNGNYYYIILILLILATTYISLTMNMNSATDMGTTKYMTWFMIIFIGIASFSLPTAIALYWIVTNAFNIVQNLILKKRSNK